LTFKNFYTKEKLKLFKVYKDLIYKKIEAI